MPQREEIDLGPQWLFLTTLAGLGMIGPFTIDAVFPSFAQMGASFGVDTVALQQTISIYLLSYAAMSLFHGPLSDALGRKPVMIVGLALYSMASAAAALAPSLGVLLACRVMQGVSAGAGQIISRAIVRDVFSGQQAQRTMSQISMIFVLGPALAPVVGGWLLGWGGWHGIFWFCTIYGLVLLFLVVFFTPETHLKYERTSFNGRELFENLWQVWKNPAGRRLAFIAGLAFGGQFLLISSAPMFVVTMLGLGANDFWVLFVPQMIGVLFGSWVSGRMAGRMDSRRLVSLGYVIGVAGGVALVLCSLFPATAQLPWIVMPIPVFTFGISVAFPIVTLAMLDSYPQARGAASSVQSFVSLICNAIISGLLAPLLATSMPVLMTGALAFVIVAAALWGWHYHVIRRSPADDSGSDPSAAQEPSPDDSPDDQDPFKKARWTRIG